MGLTALLCTTILVKTSHQLHDAVLLGKLTFPQLVMQFLSFHETRRFITTWK